MSTFKRILEAKDTSQTRTKMYGRKTRLRPSTRNTLAGRIADVKFKSSIGIDTPAGTRAQLDHQLDSAEDDRTGKRRTRTKPSSIISDLEKQRIKSSSGLSDLEKAVQQTKDPIPRSKSSQSYANWKRNAISAREKLKTTGVKFFGSPSGIDAQGKPTYAPPKKLSVGEPGRRAQRQASPRSYASVKADLEAKTKIKELKVKPKSSTKPTPAPTKPSVLKPSKVTGGTPRATDLSPTKRPTGTKTFAQFAKSGRTAAQKQATLKSLKTPPKTATRVKVTAPPKPKAPTRAAIAPKIKTPKIGPAGIAGKALGVVGAGFDVVQGRDDAKKAGASDTRAWLRGAARAAGGLIGGSLGAAGAGFVGGIAGYSGGSALADKTFTALAGATQAQKDWMKQANLDSQKGTAVDKVKYRKGNQAVIYDPRVKKERIGTLDPTSGTFKAANLAKSKAYTAKNPFERLGRQFSRSNEGSGLFGLGIVKGGGLADMAKRHYADKDEKARAQRVSDFKKAASAK